MIQVEWQVLYKNRFEVYPNQEKISKKYKEHIMKLESRLKGDLLRN